MYAAIKLAQAGIAGVIASFAASDPSGIPVWTQYGVLGLLVVALLTLQIVPGRTYSKLEKRLEDREAYIVQLEDKWEQKVLPLLSEFRISMDSAITTLKEDRTQWQTQLEKLARSTRAQARSQRPKT